ncbi:hypothetical protein [Tahibacter amnicola]|uniref:Parallel beta helix pectate lyase-like protein n=1 Tax=Tahibacter amnicola TaxID=2976241 RepID=A0ABY6BEU3_9GAMM|nr:hypothetical protein [Tahibacter amnicola]UXI68554.1 hypothetical protein N4264_02555 [Tahibacter amnicola]
MPGTLRRLFHFAGLAMAASASADAAIHVVTPTSNLQSVINAAASGDEIRFEPGLYRTGCLDIFKRLTLTARVPHSAILQGSANAPLSANAGDAAAAACGFNLARRTADGTRIEGLQFQYFRHAIYGKGLANLVIVNNRFVSNFGNGVALRDTADIEIARNAFLDPYLPNDTPGTVEPYWVNPVGVTDAQMDYGVSIYGSLRPRVHHNYFFGVFNQALSFKIANRDAYAGYNTFEGYSLTALFFGQEPSIDATYPEFGLSGWDGGRIVAEGNVFRAVRAEHPGTHALVEYRGRSPLRIRYVNGDVTVRNNIVESGILGFTIECNGSQCPMGTIDVTNNLIVGRVITGDNVAHDIGVCGIDVQPQTTAQVRVFQNTIAWHRFGVCAEGGVLRVQNTEFHRNRERDVRATPDVIDYNNQYTAAGPVLGAHSTNVDPRFYAAPDLRIRTAAVRLTPNRSFSRPFYLTPQSPGATSGSQGLFKGAYPLITTMLFEDNFEVP